tara:strand:+ start:564 stop:722 length:159 start_codon:yes stop_codon:yes gene_type:complete
MADILTTKDLSVEDTSELKTGDMKRNYGKCPPGKKRVGNKCVPISKKKKGGY